MLNAEDLRKLENIRQFVADQGVTRLDIDISGICDNPRIHMYFTLPSSQEHVEQEDRVTDAGGEVQEHGEEYTRPLTWDERHALKKMLEEGCPDFIPYKEKGRFKKFFKKAAKEAVEVWIPVLAIAIIATIMAGGIALAILKIFNICRGKL
jgi:hypothetical protein